MAKTGMTKAQIVEWALRHGWTMDKYGHLRKTFKDAKGDDSERRLKLQDTSVRHEVKVRFGRQEYSPAHSEWMRLGGGYYKDACLTAEDKLSFRRPQRMDAARRVLQGRQGGDR